MPKYKINKIELRYTGLFDFQGVYSSVIDWAKNYGYRWHEPSYKHKVPVPEGAEQEWLWQLTKNVTEYVQYNLLFTVHAFELHEVTVEVNGKKKVMTSARIYIWITGNVTYDWQGKFAKGGKVSQFLGKIYGKAMQRDVINHVDKLYYRAWNLHAVMKEFFNMQTKKHAYKDYLGEN